MAEQQYQLQTRHEGEGIKTIFPERDPSTSQVLAVITLLPVGSTLLCLSGLALAGSLVGLVVMTPLFIIFSPVLVPAALVIGLALLGFLTSGALGITALSSLTWVVNYLRKTREFLPHQLEQAKKKARVTTGQMGQKAGEMGEAVLGKAQELAMGGQ